MRAFLLWSLTFFGMACYIIGMPSVVHAGNKARAAAKDKKPLSPHDRKLQREAAQELVDWLAPLSTGGSQDLGLRTVRQWIRTWIASRWGIRATRKSWKRWVALMQYLRIWQPAQLYRNLRFKRVTPRLDYVLKGSYFRMIAPKPEAPWKAKIGDGQMTMEMNPLKRKNPQDRRPYRLTIRTQARMMPLRATQLDTALKGILERFTDPKLSVPLTQQQKKYLKTMPKGHSRKIARWLNSRVPHTAALIRKYMNVINIMEPIGKGLYKLDIRARWKLKPFKKDYPRAARALTRSNTDFSLITEFRDAQKHLWFVWSYARKNMEMRYQAVVSKDGLWMCDNNWKPISGPWRFTQMGATWTTHTHIRYMSNNIRMTMRDFKLLWKVRKTSTGATFSTELLKNPSIKLKGGQLLRLLARILISGGISGLVKRFLYNLATGDKGRGLRWKWELVEGKRRALVKLNVILPIVPDSTLTTLLRLGPGMVRRTRSTSKSKRKYKYNKGKRRRRKPPMWNRLFSALYKDLGVAQKVYANRK
jgi:hypothetical protein